MRNLFMLAIFLVFAYTYAVPQRGLPPCPENASFRPCGPACPVMCTNLRPQCPGQPCRAGCFCNPGWIQQSPGGPCVRTCPR
ncbi:cysteine-rich venom protein 1 [Diachasma alloeum]|uniref:cysteine-rich venom protein 1 n=1 Tax=Diachasma alloeum TaxID=454923 RepID=UPI0007384C7E|nr:cysteine-rich venom protein 1 [Diachasma alloeum]